MYYIIIITLRHVMIYIHSFIIILFSGVFPGNIEHKAGMQYTHTHASQFSIAKEHTKNMYRASTETITCVQDQTGISGAMRWQHTTHRTNVTPFYNLHSTQIIVLELSFTCVYISRSTTLLCTTKNS